MAALLTACPAPTGEAITVQRPGIEATVHIEANTVDVTLTADDEGWVAFGLSTKAGLSGMAFVMLRDDSRGQLEVHRAAPPQHHKIPSQAQLCFVKTSKGQTVARFRWPRAELPFLSARTFAMMAFSQSKDLEHHSRARFHFELKKPAKTR